MTTQEKKHPLDEELEEWSYNHLLEFAKWVEGTMGSTSREEFKAVMDVRASIDPSIYPDDKVYAFGYTDYGTVFSTTYEERTKELLQEEKQESKPSSLLEKLLGRIVQDGRTKLGL